MLKKHSETLLWELHCKIDKKRALLGTVQAGVFRTLPNIYDEVFLLKAVNYLCCKNSIMGI